MSIDLSKLSAKELFELAQKKEKEEQEAAEREGQLNELKKRRETMLSDHKNILLLTDKKIRDMQEQREKLIKDHEAALAKIDKEMQEMGGKVPPPEPSEERKAFAKPTASTGDPDQLKSTLRQIMNKRPYISATLLKEKLASFGIKPADFNKELEQWVRNGWFDKQGMGNYALGKKI